MNIAGVDGCRYGWIVAYYANNQYQIEIFPSISQMMQNIPPMERILIDMPMGISSPGFPRTIDATLRKHLPQRASTVFNVPCKAAVYEDDFTKAKQLNIAIEGKSLSIQTLNIKHKIKELDEYLALSQHQTIFIESHPELCFKHLNKEILLSKKSTTKGLQERLDVLHQWDNKIIELYDQALYRFKRKDVKPDDIVDALCLCLINKLGAQSKLSFITDENIQSEDGVLYRIAYFSNQ
ncbi:DUF429 domain-containing protein [Carboxylicivirga linearis]|uniref:DUF429 domain-containing protein n=1 Tax=Carboxylicivirga linearis TaxID=1628157 RepID=A0ABS5JSE8_9BACT|nr:DUF429 domain-containing protein [Carboxylicivirga linearis]MBS2097810.1 DUF429 domain-containing protein [Carboxylicivirga linearis]